MRIDRFQSMTPSMMFRGDDPKKPEEKMDWIKIYSRERDDEVVLDRYHRQREENAALKLSQQSPRQEPVTTARSKMPTDPKELQEWLWEQYNIFNRDR